MDRLIIKGCGSTQDIIDGSRCTSIATRLPPKLQDNKLCGGSLLLIHVEPKCAACICTLSTLYVSTYILYAMHYCASLGKH